MWEEPGITKQGLADFYTDIADWILPHITGRVLSLLRCPSGTSAKCFFAKHPWAGLAKRSSASTSAPKEPMIAIDDLDGLLNLVQAGVVEIHPWGSRVDRLDEPDRLIFDLDPGEDVPWSAVIAGAHEVRDRLDGARPQKLRQDHRRQGTPCDAADHARRRLGRGEGLHQIACRGNGEGGSPIVTWRRSPRRRGTGEFSSTTCATIAARPRSAPIRPAALPQATVSTPLAWDELSERIRSDHFTVGNLRNRLQFLERDPWDGFFKVKQRIPKKGW